MTSVAKKCIFLSDWIAVYWNRLTNNMQPRHGRTDGRTESECIGWCGGEQLLCAGREERHSTAPGHSVVQRHGTTK